MAPHLGVAVVGCRRIAVAVVVATALVVTLAADTSAAAPTVPAHVRGAAAAAGTGGRALSATVVDASTDPSKAVEVTSGASVLAISSPDGPVFFRIVGATGNEGAVVQVVNQEQHVSPAPVVTIQMSPGNTIDGINAFTKSTRDPSAQLELNVCDFESGNWTIGVQYQLQLGIGGALPAARAFELTFTADSGLSCEWYTALMVMGIPSLILACIVVAAVTWWCIYRRNKKPKQPKQAPLDTGLKRPPSWMRAKSGSGTPRSGGGGAAASAMNATPQPHSMSLAQQLARMSQAAQGQQGQGQGYPQYHVNARPGTGAVPAPQDPPAGPGAAYAVQSQTRPVAPAGSFGAPAPAGAGPSAPYVGAQGQPMMVPAGAYVAQGVYRAAPAHAQRRYN